MIHPTIRPALAMGLLLTFTAAAAPPADPSLTGGMLGFTCNGATQEQKLEQRFDALLDPADQREWLKQMSSQPNQVGAPHDKANADFMLAKFREWDWDAHIETFDVLYPTPEKESLQLLGSKPFTAKLNEPPLPGDASSAIQQGALPPYNVYGADGDVTAPLV